MRSVAELAVQIAVLPFDAAASPAYGNLFQHVRKRRNSFDRLIAAHAHALAIGATLVTANGRDFTDVPGLVVEDWS